MASSYNFVHLQKKIFCLSIGFLGARISRVHKQTIKMCFKAKIISLCQVKISMKNDFENFFRTYYDHRPSK